MSIKLIPLSRLEADPRGTLTECLESGEALVVELPDHRLVSIQGLEPDDNDEDGPDDRWPESDPAARPLLETSNDSPRKTLLNPSTITP
jgi:hypothetical protein